MPLEALGEDLATTSARIARIRNNQEFAGVLLP